MSTLQTSPLIRFFTLVSLLLLFPFFSAFSQSLNSELTGANNSLASWKNWVLYNKDDISCPRNSLGNKKNCVWHGRLQLKLNADETALKFTQVSMVYGKARVYLPGGKASWPQSVQLVELINKDKQVNQTAIVLQDSKGPYLFLQPGHYEIKGKLLGLSQLHNIKLPAETVLVDFYKQKNRHFIKQEKYQIDAQNYLWFKSKKQYEPSKKTDSDNLDIKVFRKITDGIPVLMESFYRINVSGKAREVVINHVMPDDFIANSYRSKLPAYLNKQKQLVIQVKPGSWTLQFVSRSPKQVKEISFFNRNKIENQSQSEIWVFEDNPSLQQVVAKSAIQIDANQTLMPQSWKKFPAFLMEASIVENDNKVVKSSISVMSLELKKRGNDTPPANQLSLKRKLWLDFSGEGMTIQDKLTGTMSRDWRLNTLAELKLGKVTLNDQSQQVSYIQKDELFAGVEIRHEKVNLQAESRIEKNPHSISATGWAEDFKKLSASLYLPPGWTIFHATGVDNISPTWINQWTLLDIFLVLLLSIMFYQLWGVKWGIVALLCLILLTHKNNAPYAIWFHLLIAISLLKFLVNRKVTQGKFYKFLSWYKYLTLMVLVISMILFWVTELRNSLYPQLSISPYQLNASTNQRIKKEYKRKHKNNVGMNAQMEESVADSFAVRGLAKQMKSNVSLHRSPKLKPKKQYYQQQIVQYDKNSQIQTGPGLPTWTFNRVALNWSGPVSQEKRIDFYFISSTWNLFLSLLMILLSASLLYLVIEPGKMLQQVKTWLPKSSVDKKDKMTETVQTSSSNKLNSLSSLILVVAVLFSISGISFPNQLSANSNAVNLDSASSYTENKSSVKNITFPPKYLLDELQQRLLMAEKCYPSCLIIEKMSINLSDQSLLLRLVVNSQAETSFTLPIDENSVNVQQVLLNDEELQQFRLKAVSKRGQQYRHIQIPLSPGKYHLIIHAQAKSDTFVLPLSVPTHHITSELNHWTVTGIRNFEPVSKQLIFQQKSIISGQKQQNNSIEDSNQLALLQAKREKNLQTSKIKGFFKVTREFNFGLDWTVTTRIEHLSDKNSAHNTAQIFNYPLLKGESVLTANRQVKNNHINVNFTPSQHHFSWRSKLKQEIKQGDAIKLQAAKTDTWIEKWIITSHTNWHLEFKGIPPIQQAISRHARYQQHSFMWRPWPNESLDINITRPQVASGKTKTITQSSRVINYGEGLSSHTLTVNFNSSQSDKQQIQLPKNARVLSLQVGSEKLAINEKKQTIEFSLPPGKTQVEIKWREPYERKFKENISHVDLGMRSVNQHLNVTIPNNQMVIYATRSPVGPVILFWGMLIVLIIISYAISRIPGVPLSSLQAFLLAIGVAPVSIEALLLIFAWFIVMSRRTLIKQPLPSYFNIMQIGLLLLTLLTLGALFYTIEVGLLGFPNLHIAGNGSSAYNLNWYSDIVLANDEVTRFSFISLPIYWYRILMLVWALWLAFISVRWAIWAWKQYSYLAYWKEIKWPKISTKQSSWGSKKMKNKEKETPIAEEKQDGQA